MNKLLTSSLILLCVSIITANAQGVSSPYEAAIWPGFRGGAVSYTFDDGCPNQFAIAIPMFNEFGFKGTFFVPTDSISDWSKLISAADSGHEIANHTVSHLQLNQLSLEQQDYQQTAASNLIDEHITSQKCLTLAYPYCVIGKDSITKKKFIAARGCSGSMEPKTPANMYNISSIICGSLGSIKTEASFKANSDYAAKKNGWVVYLIHGIDNDNGYSPLSSAELRKGLVYLSSEPSKFWVAPFGTVARYIRERNSLKIEETSASGDTITIMVTDTMNNEIFNLPVSIRRSLPEKWYSVSAYQSGKDLNAHVKAIEGVGYIYFDVVPDGPEIKIVKNDNTGIHSERMNNADACKIWANDARLVFSLPGAESTDVSIKIYDLRGVCIKEFKTLRVDQGYGSVDLSGISGETGLFIVKLSNTRDAWTKLLKL
jgi:peptidoglycan-N-acetylglucosamine deacetylase